MFTPAEADVSSTDDFPHHGLRMDRVYGYRVNCQNIRLFPEFDKTSFTADV